MEQKHGLTSPVQQILFEAENCVSQLMQADRKRRGQDFETPLAQYAYEMRRAAAEPNTLNLVSTQLDHLLTIPLRERQIREGIASTVLDSYQVITQDVLQGNSELTKNWLDGWVRSIKKAGAQNDNVRVGAYLNTFLRLDPSIAGSGHYIDDPSLSLGTFFNDPYEKVDAPFSSRLRIYGFKVMTDMAQRLEQETKFDLADEMRDRIKLTFIDLKDSMDSVLFVDTIGMYFDSMRIAMMSSPERRLTIMRHLEIFKEYIQPTELKENREGPPTRKTKLWQGSPFFPIDNYNDYSTVSHLLLAQINSLLAL